MAENSKSQALLFVQSDIPDQTLEEEEEDGEISSEQTLGNSIPNSSNFVEEEEEDEEVINIESSPYTFNFDPFSPFNMSFFVSSPSFSSQHQPQISNSCSSFSSRSESEFSDSIDYPNCFYGGEEETDQMDFITDLFDSRGEETENVPDHADFTYTISNPFLANGTRVGVSEDIAIDDDYDDFHLNTAQELGIGLGFASGGLRVVGIESDSDTEELDIVSAVDDENDDRVRNHENFWDCPRYDNDERNEAEGANARSDERDGLSSVIDRIEEISVSSEISSGGDTAAGVLEWEILLAVNNLERDLEFETDGGEGFVYTAEFDTLIGQFVETVHAMKGSPPAAKSIVDNLPLVVLKKEDVMEGNHVVCAVCKDEISVDEKVTQLPCRHHYHGECIVPWLSIRNTCPVCRFELPTDDVDYERRKSRTNDELQLGYDFELSP